MIFILFQKVRNLKSHITNFETLPKFRPQFSLQGNTPEETFSGKSIILNNYKTHFTEQKTQRIAINQQNKCKTCNS